MKRVRILLRLFSIAIVTASCAHAVPVEGAPGARASTSASLASNGPSWSARILSVAQNRGVVEQSPRGKSYGTADWSDGPGERLSTINLVFTYDGSERDLSWAVLFGSCGTASLPLIPLSSFPELNLAGGGRGDVSATFPIELPTSGAYHIDVYRDRQGGAEYLIGCGNLKFKAG